MNILARPLLALFALASVIFGYTYAEAGTFTMKWDPSPTATSYDIEQSVDGMTAWTLNKSVPAAACVGTPATCSTPVTGPSTGIMHFRATAVNAVGKTVRYTEGIWHCESCAPPTMPQNLGAK